MQLLVRPPPTKPKPDNDKAGPAGPRRWSNILDIPQQLGQDVCTPIRTLLGNFAVLLGNFKIQMITVKLEKRR